MSGVVANFATETVMLERPSAPDDYDERGRLVPAAPAAPVPLQASVQPATGRQVMRLPEGLRSDETIALWTSTRLRGALEEDTSRGDRLTWQGRVYEVQIVKAWGFAGFFEIVATRVPNG